jgi:hypothetical protein
MSVRFGFDEWKFKDTKTYIYCTIKFTIKARRKAMEQINVKVDGRKEHWTHLLGRQRKFS